MTDDAIASACRVVLRGFRGTIHVDVSHGWVALRGDVARASDRWRAEESVGHVAGALGVSAQLTVRAHNRD
jgi:osmotically-inducible protein OsmY